MRVRIDVISGFLEAGKTTFIHSLLQEERGRDGGKTVLLCCEQGTEEFRESILRRSNTTLVPVGNMKMLDKHFISSIISKYAPSRILIEYNGTWSLSHLLKIRLPSGCILNKIIFLADASTFMTYINNMRALISENISNSDIIVLNRCNTRDREQKRSIKRILKSINKSARIEYMKTGDNSSIGQMLNRYEMQKLYKNLKILLIMIFLLFLYFAMNWTKNSGFTGDTKKVQALNTVFVSILIQALPFILIGVFLSSLLQVFVSDDKFLDIFKRFKWAGFPAAVLLGVFFPVCDCAMAPLSVRLVKKGVPVYYVIVFLLSAPVVNPIVITSTLYAFPKNPEIVFLRVGMGIGIALAVGLLARLAGFSRENSINQTVFDTQCAGGYLGDFADKGICGKIIGVLQHAGLEFLKVSGFIVLGAFITAILQTFVLKGSYLEAGNNRTEALLIMLGAAVLMSVCSTSNAFIAKSFSVNFPMYSVICYMVMGPMLDLKNIMMLSAGFRKKFLAQLIIILMVTAFFGFSLLGMYLK